MIVLKQKYGTYFPVAFFLLGFLFDIMMAGRIDGLTGLIQQAIFFDHHWNLSLL